MRAAVFLRSYSTYLGGYGQNKLFALTIDAAGRAYLAEETSAYDFPVTPNSYYSRLPDSMVVPMRLANNTWPGLFTRAAVPGPAARTEALRPPGPTLFRDLRVLRRGSQDFTWRRNKTSHASCISSGVASWRPERAAGSESMAANIHAR
jgi:hypothetical protein